MNKKGKIETRRWSEWSEIQRVLGVSLFSWFPSSPSFSYGNPSSSTELLGSSINQRLYEIPAGAKGQRRKLAAVFSSPFMLAAGLIAKCAISLISTLKQTPRQAGEELFARSYILWHRILFQEGGGGWRRRRRRRSGASSGIEDGGDRGGGSPPTPSTPFSLLPSSSGVCVCVWGQTVERISLTLPSLKRVSSAWRSNDDCRPPLRHRSKVLPLLNEGPRELW